MTAEEIRASRRCGRPRCRCAYGRTVHCPAHQDRSPSLDVDQVGDKVLVVCRAGCRQVEVIEALRQRGLWPSGRDRRPLAPTRPATPLAAARQEILEAARRQPWARPGITALYEASDLVRTTRRKVGCIRAFAHHLGPDEPRCHEILGVAARLETLGFALEAELDELVAEGRRFRR